MIIVFECMVCGFVAVLHGMLREMHTANDSKFDIVHLLQNLMALIISTVDTANGSKHLQAKWFQQGNEAVYKDREVKVEIGCKKRSGGESKHLQSADSSGKKVKEEFVRVEWTVHLFSPLHSSCQLRMFGSITGHFNCSSCFFLL